MSSSVSPPAEDTTHRRRPPSRLTQRGTPFLPPSRSDCATLRALQPEFLPQAEEVLDGRPQMCYPSLCGAASSPAACSRECRVTSSIWQSKRLLSAPLCSQRPCRERPDATGAVVAKAPPYLVPKGGGGQQHGGKVVAWSAAACGARRGSEAVYGQACAGLNPSRSGAFGVVGRD